MKSTFILSVVVVVLSFFAMFQGCEYGKLQRKLDASLDESDTLIALCKDAQTIARNWRDKYDSVVSMFPGRIIFNSDTPPSGYLSAKDWETFDKQKTIHINKSKK